MSLNKRVEAKKLQSFILKKQDRTYGCSFFLTFSDFLLWQIKQAHDRIDSQQAIISSVNFTELGLPYSYKQISFISGLGKLLKYVILLLYICIIHLQDLNVDRITPGHISYLQQDFTVTVFIWENLIPAISLILIISFVFAQIVNNFFG